MAIIFIGLTLAVVYSMIKHKGKISEYDGKISTYDEKISTYDGKISSYDEKISKYDGKISTYDEKISTLENKLSSMKKKSSFCAYQDDWYDGKNGIVITYDRLLLEENDVPGSSFNTKEGIFTAGIDGTYHVDLRIGYMFTYMVRVFWQVFLAMKLKFTSGTIESKLYTKTSKDYHEIGGRNMMVKLEKGDTLDVFGQKIGDILCVTFCISLSK